jgi:hypothetical protein
MKCECGREYKKDGVWLKRHQAVCKGLIETTPKLDSITRKAFLPLLMEKIRLKSTFFQWLGND